MNTTIETNHNNPSNDEVVVLFEGVQRTMPAASESGVSLMDILATEMSAALLDLQDEEDVLEYFIRFDKTQIGMVLEQKRVIDASIDDIHRRWMKIMGVDVLPTGLEQEVKNLELQLHSKLYADVRLKALAVAYRRTRRSRLQVICELDALFDAKRKSEAKLRQVGKIKIGAARSMNNKPYLRAASVSPRSTAIN